jgi:Domain of unknown function (DUF4124)
MHPWRPWIVLATLAAFAGQAAVIYKWTDSDGVVHYSDQSVPGAEKIFTTSSSTAGTSGTSGTAGTSGTPSTANAAAPAAKKTVPALTYEQFYITSPAADQTFFGDEVIGVHLALLPSLKPDQSITWHLNGKELSDPGSGATQFILPHLERGTYVIAATITDPASGASVSTDSVNFFVRQPSELSPQHK